MPGQAKDRTSQLFGEESGRGGGSCVSCTLQVASQTGVCLPYLGSCLEGLVLMWGRRGGKRVCKHLYGSQVRVSRTMEGHAWIELDREAGRQGGRQACDQTSAVCVDDPKPSNRCSCSVHAQDGEIAGRRSSWWLC
jgi:hypothetical protein